MADFWQWKGDASTGAGLVHFTGSETVVVSGTATVAISGTSTVIITGTVTLDSGSASIGVISGDVTVQLYNGSTYDSQYNNIEGTLLASLARTALTTSADQVNYNAKGVMVFANLTVVGGSGGLTIEVQGKDPVSGAYHAILAATAALTATGTASYVVYPGASGTTTNIKQTAGLVLPRTWRLAVFVGDTSSYTYSVGYSLVV